MPPEKHRREPVRHRYYLTGEHAFADTGQLSIFLLFMAVWITDSFFFRYSSFLNDHIPLAVQVPLGVLMLFLSGYLMWTGMKLVFYDVPEVVTVIRNGVFGVIRHPIYLAEILFYLAFLLLRVSLAAAAVWLIGIAFLHYLCRHEEKLLLERFGTDYERYMKEVPMYFPRLVRRK